ncbi:MAG: hypothetical protein HQL45_14125 [Alphaproteobacteria bacterium]|nr:hypothetical protein [Alphaproteobacteria bacterium]
MSSKRARDIHTADLFEDVFAQPLKPLVQAPFDSRLRRAISEALHDARLAGKPRPMVAAEMGELLDNPRFSEDMLNKFAAESNETHNINVVYFRALIAVTGATWLLDILAEEFGCTVLKGEEAKLAAIGLKRRQIAVLSSELKRLEVTAPHTVQRRGKRS